MSVARKILREKEVEGVVVPYIREGGFVVYTTPSELEKREGGAPIMVADALEEIASSVPKQPVITDEMDTALAAASNPELVKPSKLARKRREAGVKKERKDTRPEVIVEPLATTAPQPEPATEVKDKEPKKKAAPKKKPAKKAAPKKTTKKKTEEKAAPKKKPAKKEAEKKAAPKKTTKKKAGEKAAPKKKPAKKAVEKKAAPKKTTKKKAGEKAAPKKKPAKKAAEKKAAPKKTTKKKTTEKKK